ncbi:MAG: hypothetical protein ACI8ZM_003942 [Crocinitomix sp.]|jgi:hypothetical protein
MKIYTNKSTTSKEAVKAPKSIVIDNILNFSKSLEVLQLEKTVNGEKNNIEIVLN